MCVRERVCGVGERGSVWSGRESVWEWESVWERECVGEFVWERECV